MSINYQGYPQLSENEKSFQNKTYQDHQLDRIEKLLSMLLEELRKK